MLTESFRPFSVSILPATLLGTVIGNRNKNLFFFLPKFCAVMLFSYRELIPRRNACFSSKTVRLRGQATYLVFQSDPTADEGDTFLNFTITAAGRRVQRMGGRLGYICSPLPVPTWLSFSILIAFEFEMLPSLRHLLTPLMTSIPFTSPNLSYCTSFSLLCLDEPPCSRAAKAEGFPSAAEPVVLLPKIATNSCSNVISDRQPLGGDLVPHTGQPQAPVLNHP